MATALLNDCHAVEQVVYRR